MNAIVNKLLLVGDKFMPEMHYKQTGFTYSACELLNKNKERKKKLKKRDSRKEIQDIFIKMNQIKLVQRGSASIVYKYFDKKLLVEQLKKKLHLIKNQQKNYTEKLIENLRKEKHTQLLYT